MFKLSEIVKDWKESGALQAHINLYGFWDEETFLTKSGDLGMQQYPDVLEPLLFYILHRASNQIEGSALTATFKAFILDEAWIFLRNRTIRDYITRAEKTWRKKNAAMILATQSVHELVESDMLAVVNECCATKIFLANPSIDHKLYAEIFHLNDTELELLSSLVPKLTF